MIEKALKRDFLTSPLGALLPITVQSPLFNPIFHIAYHSSESVVQSNTSYYLSRLENPYSFQKIFPIHPFDIFPKTTKVRKLDSLPPDPPIRPYSSQGGYGSSVYGRYSENV